MYRYKVRTYYINTLQVDRAKANSTHAKLKYSNQVMFKEESERILIFYHHNNQYNGAVTKSDGEKNDNVGTKAANTKPLHGI